MENERESEMAGRMRQHLRNGVPSDRAGLQMSVALELTEASPLPVLVAGLHPLRTARDVAEIMAAVRNMRGTVADVDLVLAAFFRLLALDHQLPPAFSYLLSRLIEMQELDNE